MEKHNNDDHLIVLKKLVNCFLFQKLDTPKLRKDNTYKLSVDTISFIHYFLKSGESEKLELLNEFYDKIFDIFFTKAKKMDRANLMHCYGLSRFRTCKNLILSLSSIDHFQKDQKDLEIANQLVFLQQTPKEINDYLKIQFSDILENIPVKSDYITKEDYDSILENFSTDMDYNKTLEILFSSTIQKIKGSLSSKLPFSLILLQFILFRIGIT